MPRVAGSIVVAAALSLLATAASARAATFRVITYTVPVTTPDAFGAPVALDTDVYVPTGRAPARGRPLLEIFHGGGSAKDNSFDASHARRFAAHGYVVLLYSARGHGYSSGQTTIAGPAEIRDLFDETAWALRIGGRVTPPHPDLHVDRTRIALSGYSQGGLHTNLGQVWSADPSVDPYGIRFRAIEPANTPDLVFPALVPNRVVKLSFGVALLVTYFTGTDAKVAPVVDRWIATAAADQPRLYGSGDLCDDATHDTPASTMQQDLAWRSVGCHADRMQLPWQWSQAFDDTLFPPDMAISMYRRVPGRARHRLYLSMGGHAAPAAAPEVESDRLNAQVRFLDAALDGRPLPGPAVTYWTRDPTVRVPSSSYAYPARAWYRQTANTWPPAGVRAVSYGLGADGSASTGAAPGGSTPLSPLSEDARNDPVGAAALSSTPLGTAPAGSVPATGMSGFVAAFRTPVFARARELSGSPFARLAWTPLGSDSQLVLELFDESPGGTLTLFSRGVTGLRGATPLAEQAVRVDGNAFSIRIPAGDRVLAWVMAGNPAFYKPYPSSAGGSLRLGGGASTLVLPLRTIAARGRPHRRAARPHAHPVRARGRPRGRRDRDRG